MDTQHKNYEAALKLGDELQKEKFQIEKTEKTIRISIPLSQFATLSRKATAMGISMEEMVAQNINQLLFSKEL